MLSYSLLIKYTKSNLRILGLIYVLSLVSCKVQWQSVAPDLPQIQMPRSCPKDSANCARLSTSNPYRMNHISPFRITKIENKLDDINKDSFWKQINRWASENKAQILHQAENYRHYRVLSSVWKFPDDVYIEVNEKGEVSLQAQARIGKSDLGKNPKRLIALKKFLETHMQ